MREIVIDTETTGFKPSEGDRLVEVAAIELIHHLPTGRSFQSYLDPGCDVPDEVVKVHGLTTEFLRGKPKFTEIAADFLAFIGDDPLVIHNAGFDLSFINYELGLAGLVAIDISRAIDTVMIARRKFPGAKASLDALCERYGISLAGRALHGALIDADLTAQVYLELIGGRQRGLSFAGDDDAVGGTGQNLMPARRAPRPTPLPERLTAEDAKAHAAMTGRLKGDVIWKWN